MFLTKQNKNPAGIHIGRIKLLFMLSIQIPLVSITSDYVLVTLFIGYIYIYTSVDLSIEIDSVLSASRLRSVLHVMWEEHLSK